MKEFVKEFLEYMVAKYKRTVFNIDLIKFVLISHYNKRSLMYHAIAKLWLKQFFDLIQMLGYGKYNVAELRLELNENNDDIILWVNKYTTKVKKK